jgi:2-polyprenyl-6-methoxyphenol hydroxylase-like FAD-dependent oxidoreductase
MRVTCCIAGGGPAGVMLGVLLARAGVDVLVLEKHADFLRDFRGDTIHPSTLEVMHELGVLEPFLKRPHQELRQMGGQIGDDFVTIADFSHLPTKCKFIAFIPQWDFLDFLADFGRTYPSFHLEMESEVIELLQENDRIVGARTKTPTGTREIFADLVVGADGRSSIVRQLAGLTVESLGSPIDVLWFRLSRRSEDGGQTLGRITPGRIMVMLNREDYWQCAFVIGKGQFEKLKEKGLDEFRKDIASVAPILSDRVQELRDWSDVKLLTVLVDRLIDWYRPGLLCIGDAAHAMSPIGGVGINLAIQDAVAAANILAGPLSNQTLAINDLASVQSRRMLPTRITQSAQVFMQERVMSRVLGSQRIRLPWVLRLLKVFPFLRRLPARLVGIGFRPEHVRTRDAFSTKNRAHE